MNDLGKGLIVILAGIISVATLAVIVSKKSDTANVIKGFADGFSSILKAAVSPVA